MKRNKIIVLTNSEDGIHSESVINKLEDQGEYVFRFDVDKIATGEISIDFFKKSDGYSFLIESKNGQNVYPWEIKSIWYRRPNHFDLGISDQVQKDFAEKELKEFLDGIWFFNKDVFWMNNPQKLELARKKVFQLQLANRLGFLTPKTLISNNPDKVLKFYTDCNKRIIFKTIRSTFINYGDKSFNVPTTLMTDSHMDKLSSVKRMPMFFQEYVEKDYELRVTIVGKQIFPVKIDSQKNPLTMIDWRNPDLIDKIDYRQTELPKSINDLCFLLMRKLGLHYGAIDLVKNKNGQHVFLEINPNGQWYWLEDLAGIKVSDAIAKNLKKGGFSQ